MPLACRSPDLDFRGTTTSTKNCSLGTVSEPHGPIKINANRQIALPKVLVDRVRLEPGDYVYVMQSDVEPASLIVVHRVSPDTADW